MSSYSERAIIVNAMDVLIRAAQLTNPRQANRMRIRVHHAYISAPGICKKLLGDERLFETQI